ncbi:flagellar basal body-associated FliL family protein [Hoeflea sp.]|uniref:flagellar basal body-associated FliL family protein n=1 Tax=Hoeflea sp. TaxID=1940281 RepID=UPI003B51B1CC
MADNEDQGEGQGKKKSGLVVTLAIVLVLSGVAGAGGWMLGGVLAPQVAVEEEAATEEETADAGEHGEEEATEENKPRENLIPLDPITTNLSYPSDSWIRIEVSLLFGGAPDQALADQIHQDVMTYLRTVSLQQIEGPRGFQYLRDDLRERVKLRSEGRVSDILFRTFVIE